jgi:hypothetical protein
MFLVDLKPGIAVSTRFVALLTVLLATATLSLTGCSDDADYGGQNDAGHLADAGPDAGQASDAVDADDSRDLGGFDDATDARLAPPDADAPDAGSLDTALPDTDFSDTNSPDSGAVSDADSGPDAAPDATPVELHLAGVTPSRGPVAGGTPFVLTGTGFSRDTVVYFGAARVDVTLVDSNLVGETPPGAGIGPVHIKVLDPTLGAAMLADGFTYTADVEITSVTPSRIPTEGGVQVAVAGRGFDEQTRVSFGGATGLRHTLVSPTLMRVITPPNPKGPVDVRLSNRDGIDLLPDGVTYFETLRIDAIRPSTGHTAGGEAAVVHGSGFEPGMLVEIGGAPATLASVNAAGTKASIVTPPGAAGLADARIELATGEAALRADAFYYRADIGEFSIVSVQPALGPVSGGVAATILGSGLDAPGLAVTFGGVAATIVDQGPGHAAVTVPAHPAGVVDVAVADGLGASDALVQAYSYVADLRIDSVAPGSGDVAGGASVLITGTGFVGVRSVLFGGLPAQFSVLNDSEIAATAPPHAPGSVDIVLKRDIETRRADAFIYTDDIEVYGFSPVRGSVAGNTYVTIRGRGFSEPMHVTFDGVSAADLKILDSQTLAVRTPPHPTGQAEVVVTRGAYSVAAAELYSYFNPGSRFGGAWGNPIAGAVNVTVFEQGGGPIADAYVQLSTRSDALYRGRTDANGMITLSGPQIFGEQTVTAIAAGYSSATVQHVDAENITLFLSKPPQGNGTPPAGPPPAVFTGNLIGLNKIAQPGPNEFQMAIVRTTRADPWARIPDPGTGATLMSDGIYRLNSRAGDVAIIALGGIYDNSTQTFRPIVMGVERYLVASAGQTQTVDITLDIPLDQSLTFKITNAGLHPDGPTANRVVPWLDFGFEGVFNGFGYAEGTSDVIRADNLPALSGELAGTSWWAIGGSYTNGNSFPLAEAFKKNITDMSAVVHMPVLPPIARVTSPLSSQTPVDGLVTFDLNSPVRPDFYYVSVTTFDRVTVWEAFIDGAATSFRFPDFPDFSHLPAAQRPVPYPGGAYQLMIVGVRERGTSIDNFSYANLSMDGWDSYSLWLQIVGF